ncbi:FtsX-like permease family protein [Streptococcus equinus]|uniref:FtsX-like permease family protein n=1 Tax=Streptococcus equinus TaxID=1335 RepID=UPI0012FC548D|nr:FtsX-like permease family protein [Streptococcus equinus]QGX46648.1 FtsX-like permease family protein [Streptococcus equinus]
MIWTITKANIIKNFSLYRVYFLATIGLLSVFTAFLTFTSDKMTLAKIAESGQASAIANISLVFLIVFLTIFLMYFNNFFIKRRSHELGAMAILGFSKQKLVTLLTMENLVILSVSYLISLIVGPTLYSVVVSLIINVLGIEISNQWFISSEMIVKSFGIVLIIFVINFLINISIIKGQSLIEFVNYSKKVEKQIKVKRIRSILAIMALVAAYCLCLTTMFSVTQRIWLKIGIMPISFLVIILISLGSIFTIRYGLVFILSLLKKNRKKLYQPVANVVYPKLSFRIATKSKLLIILSGLLTLTIVISGMMVMLITYSVNGISRLNPSVIEYNLQDENESVNIDKILSKYQVSQLDIHLLRLNSNPEITITDSGQTIPYFDLVKYSDYEHLAKVQGKKVLADTSAPLLINYYPTKKSLGKTFKFENGSEVTVKKVTTDNIFSFATSVTTLVVSDKFYDNLRESYPSKEMIIRTFNGNDIRHSKTFYENFKNLDDVKSSYEREYLVKTGNISTYIFISFLSILFVICTGSILYFTSLVEIMENKDEYSYLSKLGYNGQMIDKILKCEIGVLFVVPVLVGILNGGLLLIFYKYLFTDSLVANQIIFASIGTCLLVFLLLYFIVFFLTNRSARSIVRV